MLGAGADGIYVFNGAFVENEVWQEIGDLETMANKDKLFGINDFLGADSFEQLRELELQPDRVVNGENRLEVSLNTRADSTGTPIALDCALSYAR